jgi:hypothetical protein
LGDRGRQVDQSIQFRIRVIAQWISSRRCRANWFSSHLASGVVFATEVLNQILSSDSDQYQDFATILSKPFAKTPLSSLNRF